MKKLIVILLLCGAGYFGGKAYLAREVSAEVDEFIAGLRPGLVIEYDGVSSTMEGEIFIDGIEMRIQGFEDPLFIDRLGLVTPDFFYLLKLDDLNKQIARFDLPEKIGLVAEGVRLSSSADYARRLFAMYLKELDPADVDDPAAQCAGKYGFSPELLSSMGYNEIEANYRIVFLQDEVSLRIEAANEIVDMYRAEVEVTLAERITRLTAAKGKYQAKLVEGRLEFTDKSIIGRSRELCVRQGLSEEETLQAQVDTFNQYGAERGIEFDEPIMAPLKQFLNGNMTFIMTADPVEPVTFSQIKLYKPSDVPALLNLNAEVK